MRRRELRRNFGWASLKQLAISKPYKVLSSSLPGRHLLICSGDPSARRWHKMCNSRQGLTVAKLAAIPPLPRDRLALRYAGTLATRTDGVNLIDGG
jgi:hypothetical protein